MSSVVGLEMPNAWRTGQTTDPTFDISADQLNVTANRQMFLPSSTIDWAAVRHTNAADPTALQDLATKNYVDTNAGVLWSTFPAQQDVDYVSLYKNINLIEPTNPQDSATKNYVDTQGFATQLQELSDVTNPLNPSNNDLLQFNSTSGLWVAQALVVPAGNQIIAGNSSVTVIDTGQGRVETVIDNILKVQYNFTDVDMKVPLLMNLQQIRNLGPPASANDAATKDYVDTQIPIVISNTSIGELSDVTLTSVAVNEILVNNGSGQFVNQLLTKSQLPSEIAYEDEANTFTLKNVFIEGIEIAPNKNLDMAGGQIIDTKFMDFAFQATDPTTPTQALDDVRIFYDDGSSFGSPDSLLEVLIDRSGTLVKKPIPTSETIFALKDFTNGMFIDETGTRLSDNNPSIRVQIFQEANESTGTFRAVLDGLIFTIPSPDISVTMANTIDLTEGTDIAPVKHFVWLFNNAGTVELTSNTVGFPSTGDFIAIGTFLFQSRTSMFANLATGQPYAVNAPDNEIFDDSSRGHLAHINDRLLELDASYRSGIDLTTAPIVGGGTATAVTYTSTPGVSMELHLEDIESFDISAVGAIALVENDAAQQPQEVTPVVNLSADLIGMTCGDGVDLMYSSNNDTANIVVYTIHVDSEPNQTNYGVNLPFQQYSNDDAAAIADSSNFAVKNVPLNVRGITLLIAEIVIKFTTGGNYEVLAVKDLRGQIPGAAGGSGGGGGGATQLNDLSDVTIGGIPVAIDQILINDGAGQWINQVNPAGLLAANNIWTGFQDYTEQTIPANPAASDMRFYVKRVDASNQGLFVKLEQAGVIEEIRVV